RCMSGKRLGRLKLPASGSRNLPPAVCAHDRRTDGHTPSKLADFAQLTGRLVGYPRLTGGDGARKLAPETLAPRAVNPRGAGSRQCGRERGDRLPASKFVLNSL